VRIIDDSIERGELKMVVSKDRGRKRGENRVNEKRRLRSGGDSSECGCILHVVGVVWRGGGE
jgi:hypothetical protein